MGVLGVKGALFPLDRLESRLLPHIFSHVQFFEDLQKIKLPESPKNIKIVRLKFYFGCVTIGKIQFHWQFRKQLGTVQKSKVSKIMTDYESCVGVPIILQVKCQTSRVWHMFIREFGFVHYM